MRIALVGGTGDIGEGLALRFAAHTDHQLVVGSRDGERAENRAEAYEARLSEAGIDATLAAGQNPSAVSGASLAILCVPAYHVRDTVNTVAEEFADDAVIVTPAVGMRKTETGCQYAPPDIGSVTELVAATAPDDVPVVGAYHTLPAGRLADLDADLGMDTPILADDPEAGERVRAVTAEIPGLRPLNAGPLANSAEVESVTPLLVTLAHQNEGLHDLGVRFG